MKRIIDSQDTKCENGLKGGGDSPENRTSDIPTWSNLTFGFPQNKWNDRELSYTPSESFHISRCD